MSTTHPTHARVKHGPIVWREHVGPILREEGDNVLVLLKGRDDGRSPAAYQVWMPRPCLEFVAAPAA